MKTNMKTVVALVAIFATLAVSFAGFVPMAHADTGGNQFNVSISFSGSTVIATATANLRDPSVHNLLVVAAISFSGDSALNINKQGVLIYSGTVFAPVSGGSSTATFYAQGQGQGHYLVTVDFFNADTGVWLGSAWTDPEGTAG